MDCKSIFLDTLYFRADNGEMIYRVEDLIDFFEASPVQTFNSSERNLYENVEKSDSQVQGRVAIG